MKVGIVTQPLGHNYGGIIQNYALQQVLKQMGHDPYTIVIRRSQKDKCWIFKRLAHYCRRLIEIIKSPSDNLHSLNPVKHYQVNLIHLKQFVKNKINLTKAYSDNLDCVIDDYCIDALIAGSDQIWRPMYNSHIEDQYLGFAQNRNKIRKVAYAASFGTDKWEYTPDLEEKCKPLCRQLDAVSVREKSGMELCRTHWEIESEWVLDPTLLLDREEYEKICLPRQIKEPYVFVYILDKNKVLIDRIEAEAAKTNYKVVVKSAETDASIGDSVELWLSLIANAETVYTDSYHGTIFSLIFRKQFVTIVNKSRGAARFDTLSEILPIDGRIIGAEDRFPESDADYDKISEIIDKERQRSREWLKSSLER